MTFLNERFFNERITSPVSFCSLYATTIFLKASVKKTSTNGRDEYRKAIQRNFVVLVFKSACVSLKKCLNPKLVGGWTNPFKKYARQTGSFPQVRVKKRCLKPPRQRFPFDECSNTSKSREIVMGFSVRDFLAKDLGDGNGSVTPLEFSTILSWSSTTFFWKIVWLSSPDFDTSPATKRYLWGTKLILELQYLEDPWWSETSPWSCGAPNGLYKWPANGGDPKYLLSGVILHHFDFRITCFLW